MPLVTAVTQQKRHPDRYSIYIDGAFAFGLAAKDVAESGIHKGQELDPDAIEELSSRSSITKGYNLALRLLAFRRRSAREVSDYLTRKEFDRRTIESVLEILVEENLLNDKEFASAWVNDRTTLRPRSRSMLAAELMKKGIDRETIQEVLAAHGDVGEEKALDDIIASKLRQSRYQDPRKLMAYLGRQGFNYDKIKQALARLNGDD